ncbi:Nadh dehydrogenase, partial [Globisporangium splendens]
MNSHMAAMKSVARAARFNGVLLAPQQPLLLLLRRHASASEAPAAVGRIKGENSAGAHAANARGASASTPRVLLAHHWNQSRYSALPATAISRRFFSASPLHFDTHRVVKRLQEQGFSAEQSEAILDVMKDAMADSLDAQSRVLATKSEHVELKAELSERVFNSTLKFGTDLVALLFIYIAQRHMRELLERDFNNLKQDIRMLEKIDFDKIRVEIAEIEKKFLLQKQAEDETLNELRLSMEKVEKRMLQYAVGFAGTIMAVGAALMRLVL